MREIQLYIDGNRIELFKDETVIITDSLKNIKAIDKVFTEYSKTFSLPANANTNKLFKHFYNYNIINGFDARVRVPAEIEFNYNPFKKGYIKLNGVDLKNGKPDTYRITFYGETISLKNIIGDDELSDLEWLDNFNFRTNDSRITYNSSDIEEFLTTSIDRTFSGTTYTKPVQVPLLTHTQRLYYKSNEDLSTPEQDGNLHYDVTDTTIHGVKSSELKYGIKLPIIIKAIEEKYPELNFSDDFFNNLENDAFDNLYMWLHRNKGEVTVGGQIANESSQLIEFPNNTPANTSVLMVDNVLTINRVNCNLTLRFEKVLADANKSYSFIFRKDGVAIFSITPPPTNQVSIHNLGNVGTGDFTLEVVSLDNIDFTLISIDVDYPQIPAYNFYISSGPITKIAGFELNITRQIPKMKVLDFLTAIFKMYNLVAYVEEDIVVVKPLDEYYSGGKTYDITEFVDNSIIGSDIALPFKEVKYTYEGLKTLFVETHSELENKNWGELEYIGDNEENKFNGGIFNYTLPFEHMKFERLINLGDSINTDIQWGWCVNGNSEPTIGLPILFYMSLKSNSMSFINGVDEDKIPISNKEITTYFAPCNSNMDVTIFTDQPSINFNAELDEWENQVNLKTLFQDYHSEYMGDIFKIDNRLTKLKAKLPLKVLLRYNLSDRFIYIDQPYKINSIKTNFSTGISDIELINDFSGLSNPLPAPTVILLAEPNQIISPNTSTIVSALVTNVDFSDPTNIVWSQTSGTEVTLTPLAPDEFGFNLEVTNIVDNISLFATVFGGDGQAAGNSIEINIGIPGPLDVVAIAQPKIIPLSDPQTRLTAVMFGGDGTPLSYSWSKVSGTGVLLNTTGSSIKVAEISTNSIYNVVVTQSGESVNDDITVQIGEPLPGAACGQSISELSKGVFNIDFNVGVDTGTFGINYEAFNAPDRFQIIYDGLIVADSKFVGDFLTGNPPTYAPLLTTFTNVKTFDYVEGSFIDSGVSNDYTIVQADIADGTPSQPTDGTGQLFFNKTTNNQIMTVRVFSLFTSAGFTLSSICNPD